MTKIRVVIQKPVDGSGGITDAANGLNNNNGVVELGGEANKDTTVNGTGIKVIQSGDDSIESFTKLTLGNSDSSTDIAELYFEHLNQDDFDTKTEIKIRSTLTGAILQYSTMSIINGILTASVIEADEEKARVFYKDFDTDIEKSLIFGKNTTGLEVKDDSGKGIFYSNASDTVNLGAWGTEPLSVPREQRIIDNLPSKTEVVNSIISGEPTGSDRVINMVSLTQAEYDAGTPIATTFYLITDA